MKSYLIKDKLHYQTGDRVTNKELKAILQSLYDKFQIQEKAKATHIVRFGYSATRCKIKQGDKRIDGLELKESKNKREKIAIPCSVQKQ